VLVKLPKTGATVLSGDALASKVAAEAVITRSRGKQNMAALLVAH
jgi:hypothetical protein